MGKVMSKFELYERKATSAPRMTEVERLELEKGKQKRTRQWLRHQRSRRQEPQAEDELLCWLSEGVDLLRACLDNVESGIGQWHAASKTARNGRSHTSGQLPSVHQEKQDMAPKMTARGGGKHNAQNRHDRHPHKSRRRRRRQGQSPDPLALHNPGIDNSFEPAYPVTPAVDLDVPVARSYHDGQAPAWRKAKGPEPPPQSTSDHLGDVWTERMHKNSRNWSSRPWYRAAHPGLASLDEEPHLKSVRADLGNVADTNDSGSSSMPLFNISRTASMLTEQMLRDYRTNNSKDEMDRRRGGSRPRRSGIDGRKHSARSTRTHLRTRDGPTSQRMGTSGLEAGSASTLPAEFSVEHGRLSQEW